MIDREWEERNDEEGARLGDPRRCPVHGLPTSSPDGMHDAPCPACELDTDQGEADGPADVSARSYGPPAAEKKD